MRLPAAANVCSSRYQLRKKINFTNLTFAFFPSFNYLNINHTLEIKKKKKKKKVDVGAVAVNKSLSLAERIANILVKVSRVRYFCAHSYLNISLIRSRSHFQSATEERLTTATVTKHEQTWRLG